MQKPQIPIFMQITDAEWDEMVRLLCLREKKFKKNTIIFLIFILKVIKKTSG